MYIIWNIQQSRTTFRFNYRKKSNRASWSNVLEISIIGNTAIVKDHRSWILKLKCKLFSIQSFCTHVGGSNKFKKVEKLSSKYRWKFSPNEKIRQGNTRKYFLIVKPTLKSKRITEMGATPKLITFESFINASCALILTLSFTRSNI